MISKENDKYKLIDMQGMISYFATLKEAQDALKESIRECKYAAEP